MNLLEPLKVKEKVEFLKENLNEQYKDELFMTIRKDPELRKILKRITILLQYLTLFSWFFLILAVISIFFYKNKQALILFGLTSVIHILFAPLALLALRKQNRYLLFCFVLANLVWLTSIAFAFFYYMFLASNKDKTKVQFDKEIVVHVGFAFYYPISFFASYYFMKMFKLLIKEVKEINLAISVKETINNPDPASESLSRTDSKV